MATPATHTFRFTALWAPGTRNCSVPNQVLTRPSFCLQIAAQKVVGLCSSVPMVCDVGLLLKKRSSLDQNLILSCWTDTFQQCHSLWEKTTLPQVSLHLQFWALLLWLENVVSMPTDLYDWQGNQNALVNPMWDYFLMLATSEHTLGGLDLRVEILVLNFQKCKRL